MALVEDACVSWYVTPDDVTDPTSMYEWSTDNTPVSSTLGTPINATRDCTVCLTCECATNASVEDVPVFALSEMILEPTVGGTT